ncbi:hypothetical protein EXN66_Car003064 [Channa argus]|uniref:TNF family profile domain-containing protein n=1 Tax=Channa argus TaxID=215402 RepID=A0A6G1PAX9_CHAAH|nr:hypothetical protein EXN66_Car003064 [Channa argus]KAK2919226.1 hypothetical protein Q8A73_003597 [Channa argus]
MRHQNTEMDVESLQKSERRRGNCLDAFLVVSIIFLFVALTGVAVLGMMAVMDLRSNLRHPANGAQMVALTGDSPSPAYKMQNFAYLQASSSELRNSTMHWAVVQYGEGTSVGSNFKFNSELHSLEPLQVGTYFVYIYVNLTCTFQCNAGVLTMRLGDRFTCEVELPAGSTSVSRKCWTVSRMESQGLVTHMTVSKSKADMQYWKLELNSSGLGMFLVG